MLLIAMDSSFRWDDENRLVQSVPRAMIDVGIAYRSIVSCGSSQLNRGSESAAGESVKEIGGGNWTDLSRKFQYDPDLSSDFSPISPTRSEERRVGKESVKTCRSRCTP